MRRLARLIHSLLAAARQSRRTRSSLRQQLVGLLLQLGDPRLCGLRKVLELLRQSDDESAQLLRAQLGLLAQFRSPALQFADPLAGLLLRVGKSALEGFGQRIGEPCDRVQRGIVGLDGRLAGIGRRFLCPAFFLLLQLGVSGLVI